MRDGEQGESVYAVSGGGTMAAMAMAGQEMERMHSQQPVRSRASSMAERNREKFEQQRARRRGPTPEMYFAKHIDNSRIVKADDPERKREMRRFSGALAACFLLTMVYVGQHLASINLGYSVETQKTKVEQMREANRQLRLSEAEFSNPRYLDKAARELGMGEPLPGQVVRPDGQFGAQPVMAQVQGLGIRD